MAEPISAGAILLAGVSSIVSKVTSWFFGIIWKGLMSIVSIWSMWVFHALNAMAPKQAMQFWKIIVQSYKVRDPEWAPAVAEYISAMTDVDITIDELRGTPGRMAEAVGKKFLYPMLNLVLPGAAIAPGVAVPREAKLRPVDGLTGAERFLGTNLHFQMSAWLLHVLGDMQSFGMFKSLKDLPNAISWSYGLGWLSWLVMGVPFRMGISDPLERWFNQLYRPKPLSRPQIFNAWNAGYIGHTEALRRLREEGWGEEEIATLRKLEREKLSEGEMRRMWRWGFLDHDDIVDVFRERGHPVAEAQALGGTLRATEKLDILESIGREALSLYQDGVFTWAQTEPYLANAKYTATERSLFKVLAELRRIPKTGKAATERSLTPSQIGARYKAQVIGLTEAQSLLAALPYQLDQIDLFLSTFHPPEPKVEEPREVSTGVVGSLFKRGEITESQLRTDLAALDYEGWSIERIVAYYTPIVKPPPPPVPPRELPAGWIFQLHEEGHISTSAGVAMLVALDYREADARLVLETLHPRLEPEAMPERSVPASVAGSLYRAGEIGRPEAEELFRLAGYSLEAVSYLELHYRPVEPVVAPEIPYRAIPATWVFTLHEEGQITTEDAVERLVALRIRPEDASLVLETMHPVKPVIERPARVLPASIVGGLYRRELVSRVAAMEMFQDAGYDEAGAASLELYYRPVVEPTPEEVPPLELSASWILRLHREGHIPTEDAADRLVAIRWRREDANLLLQTLYAVPPPVEQVPRAVPASLAGRLYRDGLIEEAEAAELFALAGYDERGVGYLTLYYTPPPEVVPVPVPPRELSPAKVFALHQGGHIPTPEAVERLERLDFRPEDARLLLTSLYPAPTPEEIEPRAVSAGVVGGLYRSGRIDVDEATDLFLAAGYDEEGAAYLELYYQPLPEIVPLARELRPSEVARLLATHEIAWPVAVERVRPEFVSHEEMVLFLALFTPEPLPPQTAQALRSGLIEQDAAIGQVVPFFATADEAVAYLSTF